MCKYRCTVYTFASFGNFFLISFAFVENSILYLFAKHNHIFFAKRKHIMQLEKIKPVFKYKGLKGKHPVTVSLYNSGLKRKTTLRNVYLTHFFRREGLHWEYVNAGWYKGALVLWEGVPNRNESYQLSITDGGKGDTKYYTITNADLCEQIAERYGFKVPTGADAELNLSFEVQKVPNNPGYYILQPV